MSVRHLFQRNTRLERRRILLVGFHRSYEAPALVLGLKHLAASLEVGIQLRQTLPEVLDRTLEITVGHEEMLLHIVLFHLVTCLTRQDHQLADHVSTAQVDTRVWLRVTLFLGTLHGLREGYVSRNLIEDEVQRTAQDSLDLQDLVTRVAEVVDGADNRKTGTYVGLIAEPHTTVTGGLLQFQIAVVVARSGNLVGSHY